MKKVLLFLFFWFLAFAVAQSQDKKKLPGAGKDIEHKVVAKENWYSVGRLYGLSPKEIAAYNGLELENGLKIGQVIKIPVKAEIPESKTEVKSVKTEIKSVPSAVKEERPTPVFKKSTDGGFFANVYEQQSKEGKKQQLQNPVFGIFKSTSGWQDGKYYLLLNGVVPGTVVRLRAAATGIVVYAKVLGAVPQGKENQGLEMRMSNATAVALGLGEQATGGDLELVWYN